MSKAIVSLILAIFLTTGNGLAQEVFQGRSFAVDSTTHKALSKWYKSYEITDLDLDMLNHKMAKGKGNVRIDLRVGKKSWKLNLVQNEIRSFNFKSARTIGKLQTNQEKQFCITYAGYANDNPDNYVRLTISNQIFRGYIVVDDEFYYFNQLSRIVRNSNKNIIVLYQAKDVRENNSSFCGVTNEQEQAFLSKVESSAFAMQSGTSTCRILELATDADFEWFQLYGNNANSEILAIINMIEGTYQNNFNLEIVVVFQNVFTTASDPYTANPLTEPGSLALLTELRSYWENNFTNIERDIVHLFTGKESNEPTGFVGRVYSIGSICIAKDESYSFSRDKNEQFTTTAHEIGHHFGGVHTQGVICGTPDGSVMCSHDGNRHPSLYFSTGSTNTIEAFMNTNPSCLLKFDNMDITGTSVVCNNQTTTYSVNSVLNGNVTWSLNNSNLTIISGQGTPIVTVRGKSSGNGGAMLTATIPVNNCDVVDTKNIWVGKPTITFEQENGPCYEPFLVYRGPSLPSATYSWSINNPNFYVTNAGSIGYVGTYGIPDGSSQTFILTLTITEGNCTTTNTRSGVYHKPTQCDCGYGIGCDDDPPFPLSVNPNPANTFIAIKVGEETVKINTQQPYGQTREKAEVAIFNDKNRIVYSKEMVGKRLQINTQNLPNGLYYLRVKYKGQVHSRQIVVKH